jgi:probable HAF family extracellular repeat protein
MCRPTLLLLLGASLTALACSDPVTPTELVEPLAFATAEGYELIDLGTLGGSHSTAAAINAHGQVVGLAWTTGNAEGRAFLWHDGNMVDIGTLGGSSGAGDINDAGQIVGAFGSSVTHAFLWENGQMVDLGTLGGLTSDASAINSSGHVVGHSRDSMNRQRATLWKNGEICDLGCLGGASRAFDINDAGQVVGTSELAPSSVVEHAFLWTGGKMTDLGSLGGANGVSIARSINEAGDIVGASSIGEAEESPFHAVLWRNGAIIDLGPGFSPQAINSRGEIVGFAYRETPDPNSPEAVLWRDGVLMKLEDLGGARGASAHDINSSGWIVGFSWLPGDQTYHAVLWRPE